MPGRTLSALLLSLLAALPAHAQSASAAVPEPSGIALFGMGLAGIIIGRRLARRPRD